jgi:MFS family permease
VTPSANAQPGRPGAGLAPAHRAGSTAPDRWRWLALVVVLVAGFMDLLDVTIVNVAIPTILKDLDAAYAQIEWIVAGYVLGFAAVLITGGRLGDIFGRKRLFLAGVAGFTIASLLCGVSVSPAMLIGARFFEGAMAGLMVPQILAIIYVTFPPQERGKVFGIWGGILGSASAAGLIAGGLLLRWNVAGLGWRPIFLINIPVGLAAMVAGWLVIRESRSPAAPRLDLVGMALAITGVLMLVYPVTEGRSLGWPAWTFVLMAGSAVVLVIFVGYERWRTRTAGSPLVGHWPARAGRPTRATSPGRLPSSWATPPASWSWWVWACSPCPAGCGIATWTPNCWRHRERRCGPDEPRDTQHPVQHRRAGRGRRVRALADPHP